MDYPSYRYHPTQAPRIVESPHEDATLGAPWRDYPYGGEDEGMGADATDPSPDAQPARRR